MTEEPEYTVGTWRGKDNYECKSCPYKTLSKRAMVAHIADQHTEIQVTTESTVLGPTGEPVQETVVVPNHASDVVDWIGDDAGRAAMAWEVELAREFPPRVTVREAVEALINISEEEDNGSNGFDTD